MKLTVSVCVNDEEKQQSFFSLIDGDEYIMVEHFASGESQPRYWRSKDGEIWDVFTTERGGRRLNREHWMIDRVITQICEKLTEMLFEEEVL